MLSLDEIIRAVGGTPSGIDDLALTPTGVSTDTRSIEQGELFVALAGPNFDGHDFLEHAFEKGAVAALVSKDLPPARTIRVADTLRALGDIAQAYRMSLDIPVVLISGTNGKTTVKNILRDLLSLRYKTYANPGSFNNMVGLPLSVLAIEPKHEIAVLEAGISEKGEMERLCEISRPSHGLLTNIGPGHLEGLGTLQEVFEAKWELAQAIRSRKGRLYLNADYPEFLKRAMKEKIAYRTFGVQAEAEFTPADVHYGMDGTEFKFNGEEFYLTLLGAGNLSNAVASLAVAAGEFGIPLPEAATVLSEAKPERWRLEHRKAGDLNLLIDCYNANPVSMREALELLTLFPSPRIAVLGAMLELGKESERYHHEILELARDTADLVIITGPHSDSYPKHEGVLFIPDKSKAAEEIHKRLLPEASVLIKGSRDCALEDVVSRLWGGA
jgi:UDP-N-acetylmuramoyl-tripeptide--D-alanyl-D-alanine ligase